MALMPVEEARARILAGVKPLAAERVGLDAALGRVLAKPVRATRDQPPFAASAMDGFAVRAEDVATVPATLDIIGTSAAGQGFRRQLRTGQAVRIFTGAPLPPGADAVVIQENTVRPDADHVTIHAPARPAQNVRDRGLDFRHGEDLLPAAIRLNARDIGLASAGNAAAIAVRRRPVVAIFATGDELVLPGQRPRPDQIVSSNGKALAALVRQVGGEVMDLGIVPDNLRATVRAVRRAAPAHVLVTTGGASVGDHDFVQEALLSAGVKIDFWKIAMRPGKPFMYGRKSGQHVLGLPGNPVSALVCARLFLKPLLDTLLGLPTGDDHVMARLGSPMKANDERQDYVRARLDVGSDGSRVATPYAKQDSSMQRTFRNADCLIVRPPRAPAADAGALVPVLLIDF
ncbi:MAG: gephyrin-like molybdotransferase Glp [Hyphomicrobiales bacterium]